MTGHLFLLVSVMGSNLRTAELGKAESRKGTPIVVLLITQEYLELYEPLEIQATNLDCACVSVQMFLRSL